MTLLIAYDVSTIKSEGQKRLRDVSKICKNYGQRVQNSVFECSVTTLQRESLLSELRDKINKDEDSLRVYVLREPLANYCTHIGTKPTVDFTDVLMV